ncbi:uncharacterized protein LOC119084007 [Bradysia coprophila]|uniref:uncharacterized protein LOC119084007 n=1 Tax=Bradysia coprophila TaxID=38358 RepID=UPI00187D9F61|nr:uncharacterized protein LOC119084007 [Bradysia coprophila]
MENSEEPKTDVEAEPAKPTLIERLKAKRWTFKVKNNLTQYVTVEPLICFYMFQIFLLSLIEPYLFHKACLSLPDENAYFCDVITISQNEFEPCASFYRLKVYCKGFGNDTAEVDCEDIIDMYEDNATAVFVKPEDYRFCQIIGNTTTNAYTGIESLVGTSAYVMQFLVVMIVSIWSDKYSKRKICLILPILGQLIISILNLHGALSNALSFELINNATRYIESLSGGLSLFLFGCFSYMTNDAIRQKLLFRFGIISSVLTVYRYIPYVYDTVYQYYHNQDSYIILISLNLTLNIVCLFYVKVILNESKDKVMNESDNESILASVNNDPAPSISNGKGSTTRKTKRKKLAKAFSLDVIWDYILIVFKKRFHTGRLIIILFLGIVFIGNTSIYDERFKLTIPWFSFDVIDVDGVIFLIISLNMLLSKISDVTIAILVIGIPTLARLLMVILNMMFDSIDIDVSDTSGTDFYTPFKRIASCSLLLAYVDKNETRIFLIVQATAYLAKVGFQFVYYQNNPRYIDFIIEMWMIFGMPVLQFIGLGVLYKIGKNYAKFASEHLPTKKTTEDITRNPWSFIQPVNFEIKNGTDKEQLSPAASKEDEHSTDL